MNLTSLFCGAFLSIVALTSCGGGTVYSDFKKFDEDKGWDTKDVAVFNVDIENTDQLCDIAMNIRHADAYPFNNVYVQLESNYPDGQKKVDTLNLILADDKGRWTGEGLGDIWDAKIDLKKGTRFPIKGKYTFKAKHIMRVNPLPLLMEVGMTIEKAK